MKVKKDSLNSAVNLMIVRRSLLIHKMQWLEAAIKCLRKVMPEG